MATAGSIVLDLLCRTGSFETDLNRASKLAKLRAREMRKAFDDSFRGMAIAVAGFAAGFLSVQAAFEGFRNAIDQADKLNDFNQRLGISAEKLSAWGYAARQTGTDIDSLGKGLRFLAKNMADALDPKSSKARIFEALGVNIKDAEGRLRDLESMLPEIAEAFKQLDNETLESALAMELFGKNGAELIEFLNQGRDGLQSMEEKAKALGIVLSQDTLSAADAFKDEVDNLKSATQGLFTQISAELLPELTELVRRFSALVSNGDLARNAVTLLSSAFDLGVGALQTYVGLVNRASIAFELLAKNASGYWEIQKNLMTFGFADGSVAGGAQKIGGAFSEGQAQLDWLIEQERSQGGARVFFAGRDPEPAGLFRQSASEQALERRNRELEARISRALSSGGGGGKKKEGKSEAEKEAERLQQRYESLEASLRERIALHGQESEVAKVNYETQNGELAKLSEAQKQTLLQLASEIDALNKKHEIEEKAKQLTESLMTPTEELNKLRKEAAELLEAGAISQETYNRALEAYKEPGQQLLEDLQFELELLRMTNAERQTAIALRGLDAESVKKYGDQVREAFDRLERESKLIDFVDGVRGEFEDLFVSLVDGSKSASEAFKDFFDNIAAMITRMIAERWVEQLFGQRGTTGKGSTGGDWVSMLFGLFGFGGGRAGGGDTLPGRAYLVGEEGPEMFVPRTAGTVIPAAKTSMALSGGASFQQSLNVTIAGRPDRRTPEQIARAAGREARRAMARTGS